MYLCQTFGDKVFHKIFYSPSYVRSVTLSNEIVVSEEDLLEGASFSSEVDSCFKESCCVLTRRQLLVSLLLPSKKSHPSIADRSEQSMEQSKWVAPLRQLSSKPGLLLLLLNPAIVLVVAARWDIVTVVPSPLVMV